MYTLVTFSIGTVLKFVYSKHPEKETLSDRITSVSMFIFLQIIYI